MCRWVVYKGMPVLISAITHEPEHSLVNQSKNGGYIPGCNDPHSKRNIRVNGDGFGLAWYSATRPNESACLFRCITPAWNNFNLKNIVKHVESPLIFAHVRAVHGCYGSNKNDISEDNTHPFVYKRYTFMHNGDVSGFSRMKRRLRAMLPDALYDMLTGSTDSEHCFAVLLDEIGDTDRELTDQELADAVERMIVRITRLQKTHGVTKGSSLNFAVTDGRHIVATRCRNDPSEAPPSLYYYYAERSGMRECSKSKAARVDSGSEAAAPADAGGAVDSGSSLRSSLPALCRGITISSEPLTRCSGRWALVPANHMIIVSHVDPGPDSEGGGGRKVSIRPIHVEDIREPLSDLGSDLIEPDPHDDRNFPAEEPRLISASAACPIATKQK